LAETLLSRLRDGALGVEVTLGSGIQPAVDDDRHCEVDLPDLPSRVWILHFTDVWLDVSAASWPTLERDVARQTRALFEQVFQSPRPDGRPRPERPRTADPTWSPLVELARVPVDGGEALHVLHRMAYEPGHEVVMGHLLVPAASGLVEIRWVARAQMTGYRESAITIKADFASGLPEPGQRKIPAQAVFDDPALDEAFPMHPLSVARAARRWCQENVRVRVVAPAPQDRRQELRLEGLGCALVPPPRFVKPAPASPGPNGVPWVGMNRASFAGSDGVDWLFVEAFAGAKGLSRLRARKTAGDVEALARQVYASAGVSDIRTAVAPAGDGAPGGARVIVDGEGHAGPLRMAARGTELADRTLALLYLTTTASMPAADLLAEVDAAARTLRPLAVTG
jgi:hypothetical protein